MIFGICRPGDLLLLAGVIQSPPDSGRIKMLCRLSETEGGGRDRSVLRLILESEDFKKYALCLRKCVIESDARLVDCAMRNSVDPLFGLRNRVDRE